MSENTTAPSDNITNEQRLPSGPKDDVDTLALTSAQNQANSLRKLDTDANAKALPSITHIPVSDDSDIKRQVGSGFGSNPLHIKDSEAFPHSSIEALKEGMDKVTKQCNDLKTALLSKDTSLTDSVQDLFNSLKVLSHNQSVLENKLDDVMKNQVNTDILVNNLNERLNKLPTMLQNTSKVNHSNLLIENSSNNTSSQHNTSSSRRGPGRPRKDASTSTMNKLVSNAASVNLKSASNQGAPLSPVNITLPTAVVQTSKSKRYFVEPSTKQESLLLSAPSSSRDDADMSLTSVPQRTNNENGKERPSTANSSSITPTPVTPNNLIQIKRKRGRPPKKRTVETMISNSTDTIEKSDASNRIKNEIPINSLLPSSKFHQIPSSPSNPVSQPAPVRTSRSATQEIDTKSLELASPISTYGDPNAEDSNTTDTVHNNVEGKVNAEENKTEKEKIITIKSSSENSGNNTTNNNNTDNVIKFSANSDINSDIRRLMVNDQFSLSYDARGNITVKLPPVSSPAAATAAAAAAVTSEMNRQQRELDKRRDSREKMLVNMKYNDRDKAKSFMESNKKLLKAMKEEERRKRMTSIIHDNHLNLNLNEISTRSKIKSAEKPTTKGSSMSPKPRSASISGISDHQQEGYQPSEQEKLVDIDNEGSNANSDSLKMGLTISAADTVHKVGIQSMLNSGEEAITKENAEYERKTPGDEETTTFVPLENSQPSDTIRKRTAGDDGALDQTENTSISPKKRRTEDHIKGEEDEGERGVGNSGTLATVENVSGDISADLSKGSSSIHNDTESANDSSNGNGNLSLGTESRNTLLTATPIELICREGFFYRRDIPDVPITTGAYLEFKFKAKEEELINSSINEEDYAAKSKHEKMNAHFFKPDIQEETELAFEILSKTTLTEKYVNSLEYFLMEFRWENKLVGLGLKLRESKRTWQRRKALFALFEFWRDQSRDKRRFHNYTILHAVKEMENYRIFINRSVSWFYNHITLLKMILYDLCDNVTTQWREWMFPHNETLPALGQDGINEDNLNETIDNMLIFDFLDDGSENNQVKYSRIIPPDIR
ncbi:BCN_G0011950.mRNA.1.CDS.1 [Saccharomyces cerevisiae]|nr:BCN_G0011950.mRNA.1.CDS.1 [Saccharomyces cerevisiae]CAI7079165.1 BCN_G0011950.mRNA.1.CDS.1 [Saccharomyces cerevisiae]